MTKYSELRLPADRHYGKETQDIECNIQNTANFDCNFNGCFWDVLFDFLPSDKTGKA